MRFSLYIIVIEYYVIVLAVVDIESKIRNLRSQYRCEKKKVQTKSGSGVGRGKPWWLSEKLAFLARHLEPKKGQSTLEEVKKTNKLSSNSIYN